MIDEFLEKLDYEAGQYDKPDGYQQVLHAWLHPDCMLAGFTLSLLTFPQLITLSLSASGHNLQPVFM